MKKPLLSFLPAVALLAVTVVAGGGCGGPPVPQDLMLEQARNGGADMPVAMKGDATFMSGTIHVYATVARGFARGKSAGPLPPKKKGFFSHDTDAFSENYSFDYGDSEEEQKEAIKSYMRQAMARRAAGSPMPPVTLRIVLENTGAQEIEVAPTEANSDLGNFAVRPQKVVIAAGQKNILDPMISQLGVTSDEIPLTVTLKVAGKSETQVILVKNIIAPSLRK